MKKVNFAFINKKMAAVSAAISTAFLAGSAHAASNLPSTFTTDMADTKADILIVGSALIGLAVVAVGIKWTKGTILS